MTESYHALLTAWDEEFARNRRVHGNRIGCRAGCSDCCHQLFQITEPEVAQIRAGMKELDPDTAERVRTRARQYLPEREKLVRNRGGEPEAWGSLPPPGARLACPALENGVCLIYSHRPLICRKFGVPLWNPDRPGRVYACELNFRDGEAIEDGQLVQIQTGLHVQWKAVQAEYNDRGGVRDSQPITIARAILEELGTLL
jgi:Fe-S-cluster containining protein